MAERKRRAECEYGEEATEGTHYTINHKQPHYEDGFEYVAEHRLKAEFAPLLIAILT